MSGFMTALARMGLVELDESPPATASPPRSSEDVERILRQVSPARRSGKTRGPSGSEEPPPPPPPGAGIVEQRPLERIYADHQVPPSAYPAEKLLKVLEGLRAMEPATRQAAVAAMDAADDTWTIQDTVADARHKIEALRRARTSLQQAVARAEDQARADREAQERRQQQATTEIRKQIAELEALLHDELQKVAQEKAAIQARLESVHQAARREARRYDAEMARLSEIPRTFAPAPGPGDPQEA